VQFTGGTSFQRSLNDLVKTNGVDARVRYDDDDTVDASSTLDLSSSASVQTPEGTVSSSQPGMLGYVEGFPTNLNVYGFGKDATEAGEKVKEVTDRVLRSIDGGNRGAYVIAHHINTPGVLMLQKHLETFRDALEKRNCALSIVTTVREPVMHRVSELLKFFPAPLEKDLKSVLKNEPAFPEAKGATPFKQLREFLFMDQFDVAKEQIGTTAGSENAGDGAGEAIEANALFEAVTRAAERRGLAVDAFLEEGGFDDADLTEEERSVIGTSPAEASQKFDAALNAVVRVADDLIRTFDITLVRTEDQGEGLERLANKMDWHPELMQTEGTDAFETAQRNARDVMNAHTFTSDEDEVDVDLLPFSLRKSLHTWTELDLALYALAAAQAERFRTARDSPENGAEPDCDPPNLLDAYALAKAARPDAARPDRKTGGTRAVLDAVRGASGCLPRAVSVLNAFFRIRRAHGGCDSDARERRQRRRVGDRDGCDSDARERRERRRVGDRDGCDSDARERRERRRVGDRDGCDSDARERRERRRVGDRDGWRFRRPRTTTTTSRRRPRRMRFRRPRTTRAPPKTRWPRCCVRRRRGRRRRTPARSLTARVWVS
jgi:hypothetical protein